MMRWRVLNGSVGSADVVERRRDLFVVVGVLVRKHQRGCRRDCSGLVAVDLLDLGRPFLACVAEVETVPADPLRGAAPIAVLDRGGLNTDKVDYLSSRQHPCCTLIARPPMSEVKRLLELGARYCE